MKQIAGIGAVLGECGDRGIVGQASGKMLSCKSIMLKSEMFHIEARILSLEGGINENAWKVRFVWVFNEVLMSIIKTIVYI
jgi:hypothetical protein